MKLSVVIPVIISDENYRKMTLDCINSIKSSFSGHDVEFIIVDNNSPVPVDFFGPNFHILRNPRNVGIARSWNQGLGTASGEVIFFVNNDTIIKNHIGKLLEGFSKYMVVAPTCISHISEIDLMYKNGLPDFYTGDNGAFFGVKRRLFNIIGGFDEDYYPMYFEDLDFFRRATKEGHVPMLCRDVGVVHLCNQTTNVVPEKEAIYDKNEKTFKEKARGTYSPRPDFSFVIPHHNRHDHLRRLLDNLSKIMPMTTPKIIISGGSFGENCNAGAAMVETECICFLNDDVIIPSATVFASMIDSGGDIVGCNIKPAKTEGITLNVPSVTINGHYFDKDGYLKICDSQNPSAKKPDYPSGCCLMVKKDVFDDIGGFSPVFKNGMEDTDIFLKAESLRYKIKIVPDTIEHYGFQSEGRLTDNDQNILEFNKIWGPKYKIDPARIK